MYNAEVLSKFPVVQHFPFGTLFSWERDSNAVQPPSSVHTSNQPKKIETGSVSISSASQRYPAQEPSKAPWGAATSTNQPEALPRTSAPWASGSASAVRTNINSVGSNPTSSQFPRPSSYRSIDPTTTVRTHGTNNRIQTNTGNTDTGANAMPPPTKAPWAK
jgi:serine/threonine-protein phosphatase 2A activator